MKKVLIITVMAIAMFNFTSCCTTSQNGTAVGYITDFYNEGAIWKSWEGHINMTQTGTNTAQGCNFSIDNDVKIDTALINKLQMAVDSGYKVKLTYHAYLGTNWFQNKGCTNNFVTACDYIK